MQLKIQTKPNEQMKTESREPVKMLKAFSELSGSAYEVLGLPYGGPFKGRDSDGQTFTDSTDAWMKEGDERPVTYYHGFGPDSKDEWQDPPRVIGTAKFTRKDNKGFWFDVKLDPEEPLAKRILDADPNTVRASSGAVGHLVRVDGDQVINTWPVGELALFDTNEWRKPANDFAVFMAKGEITEADAKAETQADAVDITPEP